MKLIRIMFIVCALVILNLMANPITSPVGTFFYPSSFSTPIHVQKVYDPSTGKIGIVTDNPMVKTPADLEHYRQIENSTEKAKHGVMRPDLGQMIDTMGINSTTDVVIIMRQPDFKYLDKTKGYTDAQLKANSLAVAQLTSVKSVSTVLSQYGIVSNISVQGSSTTGASAGTLKKADIIKLAFDTNVAGISRNIPELPCATVTTTPFANFATSAFNPPPMPTTGMGSGVNVATFEIGVWNYLVQYHKLTSSRVTLILPNNNYDPSWTMHSNLTATCLMNAAPKANFFHYGVGAVPSYGISPDDPGYTWIAKNGIATVSLSYNRGGDCNSYEMVCIDDMAYRYPYTVFCNPAGNYGFAYQCNWQCYNAINVGNIQNTNREYFEFNLNPCTQAANPPPVYGSSYVTTLTPTSGDREMPYVVAPGYSPDANYMADVAIDSVLHYNKVSPAFIPSSCGTSYSAPIVNGIAADVIGAFPAKFARWPEATRLAIMLTAQNVTDGYWNPVIDGKDGCGAVCGSAAVAFALNAPEIGPVATNAAPGINTAMTDEIVVGSMDSGAVPLSFNIKIPTIKPTGKHLRVIITWDASPDILFMVNNLSDLDLSVFYANSILAGASQSWEGNVECVDVMNDAKLVAGSTCTAKIMPYNIRISSGARSKVFYYALGWTWVKDHAATATSPQLNKREVEYCSEISKLRNTNFMYNICDSISALDTTQKFPVAIHLVQPLNSAALTQLFTTYPLYDTSTCWTGTNYCSTYSISRTCGTHRLDAPKLDSVNGYVVVSATGSVLKELSSEALVSSMEFYDPSICPDNSMVKKTESQNSKSIQSLLRALRAGKLVNAKVSIYTLSGKSIPLSVIRDNSLNHCGTYVVKVSDHGQDYFFKNLLVK